MKHKIIALLGACAALSLPALAQDTTTPPAKCGKCGGKHIDRTELFKKLDTNGDGVLSKDEFMALAAKAHDPAKAKERLEKRFAKLDTNKDGVISLDEFLAAPEHKWGGHHHHHQGGNGEGQPTPAPAAQ